MIKLNYTAGIRNPKGQTVYHPPGFLVTLGADEEQSLVDRGLAARVENADATPDSAGYTLPSGRPFEPLTDKES